MAELLLSCQGLRKAFGAAPLFDDLSFAIAQGDHVGVVGPNGSGKTTLLRIVAGPEEPSPGPRSVGARPRAGDRAEGPAVRAGATGGPGLRAAVLGGRVADGVVRL